MSDETSPIQSLDTGRLLAHLIGSFAFCAGVAILLLLFSQTARDAVWLTEVSTSDGNDERLIISGGEGSDILMSTDDTDRLEDTSSETSTEDNNPAHTTTVQDPDQRHISSNIPTVNGSSFDLDNQKQIRRSAPAEDLNSEIDTWDADSYRSVIISDKPKAQNYPILSPREVLNETEICLFDCNNNTKPKTSDVIP